MKLVKTPTINGTSKTKSLNLYTVAAKTIGADNIKEYLAEASLDKPSARPVVIVIPERDTPGINASDCDKPIKKVCLNVIFS